MYIHDNTFQRIKNRFKKWDIIRTEDILLVRKDYLTRDAETVCVSITKTNIFAYIYIDDDGDTKYVTLKQLNSGNLSAKIRSGMVTLNLARMEEKAKFKFIKYKGRKELPVMTRLFDEDTVKELWNKQTGLRILLKEIY